MSRYDGLIIPRSYSEYINKTDAATLLQALQLSGVMDNAPTANSNHPVKSGGVATAFNNYVEEKILQDNTDVNTLLTEGIYKAQGITGLTNIPSEVLYNNSELWGVIEVIKYAEGLGGTYQIITGFNNAKTQKYIRRISGGWSNWERIITSSDEDFILSPNGIIPDTAREIQINVNFSTVSGVREYTTQVTKAQLNTTKGIYLGGYYYNDQDYGYARIQYNDTTKTISKGVVYWTGNDITSTATLEIYYR